MTCLRLNSLIFASDLASFCFALAVVPKIQFVARLNSPFPAENNSHRPAQNVARGMHSQLSSRGHHGVGKQPEPPELLQGLRKINLFAGEESFIEPAGRLKILPGREKKSSGAEIRSGKVECGENVNENATPKRHRTVSGDTRAAARATGR